jgi:hypothetical protein
MSARNRDVLPPDHPAWLALEKLLESIEPAEFDLMDDEWLDDLRAGWQERLEDLYGSVDEDK